MAACPIVNTLRPLITVCIATYNGARYLRQQLDSILHQLPTDSEIIISDDGSTDGTLELLLQIQATTAVPISVLTNPGPEHGSTANFEHALRHAQGDFIFVADQDDVWMDHKVEIMMQHLTQPGYSMVVSNARIVDADLHVICDDYYAARGVYRGLIGNFVKFGYLGCCMALSRHALQCALPFPRRRDYCNHDNWLYLCASVTGRVEVLSESLLLYRRHEDNLSPGALNAHKSFGFRLRYRLYLAWHLLRHWLQA